MQSRLVRSTSLALVLSAAVVSGSRAVSAAPFAAQTVYLHQGIEGYHRITIQGELDGAGTVSLDPNTCSVDEFGDTAICTEIAPTIVSITLQDTQKADPDGLGRKLYLLVGAGLQNPLFVVVWPTADHPPRLIYNHRGVNAPVPITLEPLAMAAVASAAPTWRGVPGSTRRLRFRATSRVCRRPPDTRHSWTSCRSLCFHRSFNCCTSRPPV
jgi:hypothetical protein